MENILEMGPFKGSLGSTGVDFNFSALLNFGNYRSEWMELKINT